MGSLVEVHGLSNWQGLTSPTACGILVPQSATEPEFPALEGGFLTTGHWEISQINFKKNFLFFFKKKIFFIEG